MIVGIIKPKGPTSHDMIYQVRKITHEKRVGHGGTLDPMASGVLVVAIGRASTKQLGTIMNHDKEYLATIRLGATSTTDDAEGEIIERSNNFQFSSFKINTILKQFIGTIKQIPPMYSALKKDGHKLYELARKGQVLELDPREVVIHSIELTKYDWPTLELKVHCGKGVYIRSLARDIGAALGTGGYLAGLERTRVGDYTLSNSMTIEAFSDYWQHADSQSD